MAKFDKLALLAKKYRNELFEKFVIMKQGHPGSTFSILEINNPDDEMLLTYLTKLLVDKQFIVNSNDIFEYILRRVDRTYDGIYDIVSKLDVLSLEKKRQLTIPLIKEIL